MPRERSKRTTQSRQYQHAVNGRSEVICRKGPWRTLEAVEFATLTWVDWFNHRRLLEPIGYVPPAEYEARYDEQAAVA